MTNSITQNALKALLYELVTLPKPGLVDPLNQGPHPDMDVYTFVNSSLSLEEYFANAETLGRTFTKTDLTQLFFQLRQKGITAEQKMVTATNGINTHKGAIFALGIFVCAESYCTTNHTELFTTIQKMCNGLVKHDLVQNNQLKTAGEQEFYKYGAGGARAQAEQGYPVVRDTALPFLKNSTGSFQTRLLDTLMKIATITEDSNFIKRAGSYDSIRCLHKKAAAYLTAGGYATTEGRQKLLQLNAECLANNYSLGGCADLLIVTIFVALERGYI
ncbi:triphosphoribosyl-dephospho-CoA synthase [Lactobacillus xylocopicola]|uniref:Probable 2-(5''-triphosphoribosyl)-3'-dephosphocoenzyme-A synthase n=1 Tax=Lactobacillus xylocopicola TaxID=2976676 RepID=A0ABN6SLC2_9LACO|nr:triphosphoribosyl-dephospho-CoA synthase [Lactobacillus xylocopicola]BDR59811.1 putative 2-(5''-triphosphoribosyl)-3'-dephosphocoenzyme-A synthase [Lactobacillus xylocopicola]